MFCPGCGVRLNDQLECPRCGPHARDLVFDLVELPPLAEHGAVEELIRAQPTMRVAMRGGSVGRAQPSQGQGNLQG